MPSPKKMYEYANGICENHITRYTIQLWKFHEKFDYKSKNNKLIPKPKGTGILLSYIGKHFILTAKHVVEDVTEENLLFFRSGADEYLTVQGNVGMMDTEKDSEIDLAFIELSKNNISVINRIINQKFLTPDNVGALFSPIENDTIIACGYPEQTTTISKGSLEVTVTGEYMFLTHVNDKVYKHYNYDKNVKIGCSYHGSSYNINTKKKTKKVQPYGMSGGGIWRVGVEEFFDQELVRYHLVGIMTNVENNRYHVIWSTRIEIMMEFISRTYGFKPSIKPSKT